MKFQKRGRSGSKGAEEQVKSRKEMRKEKKQEKKERKKHFHQHRGHTLGEHKIQPLSHKITKNLHGVPKSNKNNEMVQEKSVKVAKEAPKEKKIKKKIIEETEEDKIIKLYEDRLGMGKAKGKYKKIAKNYAMDDDLFDFLDGISKKVQGQPQQYIHDEQEEQNIEQDQEQQSIEEAPRNKRKIKKFDSLQVEADDARQVDEIEDSPSRQIIDEEDEMFDDVEAEERSFLDEEIQGIPWDQQHGEEQFEDGGEEQLQAEEEQIIEAEPETKPKRQSFAHKSGNQNIQIKKSMNRLLNKLSDGNVLFTFRQFLTIIESYPKSTTIPIYSQTFTKFNLMIEKPLFHILATNAALLVALHYAIGNRLMAPVLYTISQKYLVVDQEEQNEEEVMELGYSKRFERLKNYATIVSLLYNYKSITGQFIQSYVNWLTAHLNKANIELIYILIQKSGIKIRQNDPTTLKNMITNIKAAIETYKGQCGSDEEQMQKIKFIQLQLNQIRFNKKEVNAIDQRMAFLETFVHKNVKKQLQKQDEIFPMNFQQLIEADTSNTLWWEGTTQTAQGFQQQDEMQQEALGLTKQKRQLMELAKSFHMVTEAKKNIFIALMDSKDYLQATQRILQLSVKNMQDIATVLVEVCTLEPNFNPYYPLVAGKIASIRPKFRLNLQYAIWDHLKLLAQYELRRTSNLAKFAAKLISDPTSNCSLSILKFYPDLSNVSALGLTFLNIFFTHFFKKVKKEYLSKLVSKLRERNNQDVKIGIKEFLSEFDCETGLKPKVKLCRKLLLIEVDDHTREMDNQLE